VAATAKPDTILGWYRKFIANKFDVSLPKMLSGANAFGISNIREAETEATNQAIRM